MLSATTSKNGFIPYVHQLFEEAITREITDIHIEPFHNHTRIRCRRDGLLYEFGVIANDFSQQMTTHIKIMAHLNITEKRLPQDGRIKIEKPFAMDMRINTCPTLYGEKMVIRLQHGKNRSFSMNSIGLNADQEKFLLQKLDEPQGLIIVTGPTGSGKTLTLYHAIHYLNTVDKNISTVEDPVEIEIPHINQVNVNTAIGFDFAAILRTLLRQDPDVIMIGEIRDQETARIATHAAQTGHLVLSTLHCRNTQEAILRLKMLDITENQLSNAISLVISQRLVRKICTPDQHCKDGYLGRTGLFEFGILSSKTKVLTLTDPLNTTLRQSAQEKIDRGITDEKEVLRVLGNTA